MRTKSHEARRLLASRAAQNPLHRRREIIVPQCPKHPAKVGQGQLVRFQKRLLRRAPIGAMKGRAARHRAHREHLQLHALAVHLGPRLVPVHLRFLAPVVALRHERLALLQSKLALALLNVLPHRALGHFATGFLPYPVPDTVRRVTLLTRRLAVLFENAVDEPHRRRQLGAPSRRLLARRRQRAGYRLAHHPPVHAQLARHPLDRPTPNSYSRRISSNSSTLLLQSNSFLRCGRFPQTEYPLIVLGGPNQGAERGQFRMPNSALPCFFTTTALSDSPPRPPPCRRRLELRPPPHGASRL